MLLTYLAADLPETVTEPFNQLLGWILWLLCLAGVARLFWIGGQLGHSHHNPHADPPDTPLGVVVGLMVGSSAVGIAAALVTF